MKDNNVNSESYHSISHEKVLETLESSPMGLSKEEIRQRLLKYGANQIKRKSKDGPLQLLWRQINNPLIWVLLGSTAVAMLIGKITDGLVVFAVVVINTIIGFIQEFKAGKAIEALSDMVPQNASVIRDGKNLIVPVTELVPGDIVLLASGDRVPADMRLIQQKNLLVEEAALTGESLPSQKNIQPVSRESSLGDRTNMVYGGTLVSAGTATAVVTGTGLMTELGKISNMLSEATDLETPLTKKLATIGKYLTIGILSITVVIMIVGTLRAMAQGIFLENALKDSLIFAIALAVGAIPEGLPAVVTIALAIGVQRMAKRNAIIRKLPAVETLGSTTVICTDKTGTLTRNEMTVTELWTPEMVVQVTGTGYKPEGSFEWGNQKSEKPDDIIMNLLTNAVLCSDSEYYKTGNKWEITGDPTEAAMVVAAGKAGIDFKKIRKDFRRIDVFPFESENQYMATLNEFGENHRIIIKGAPEVVMSRCVDNAGKSTANLTEVTKEIERMGKKGMRVIAVAQKQNPLQTGNSELTPDMLVTGFTFTGLIGMIDPPRTEAIEAIKICHDAGIVVKMITGDHQATARSIGIELGLSDKGDVVTGAELSAMNDQELQNAALNVNIFARVAPEHKLNIVKALQKNNHIVSMTGDGVNDAPSLKQANIGVAMGITGTSVSKESSDIILADDNFASISAAVEEGRRVYDNLLKSLAFILPTNIGLALILIYSIMFFPFDPITKSLLLPMLPTQLLWINLVAAIALALPLAFEVKEPNVMRRAPRNPEEPLFNRFVTFRVFFVSVLMSAGAIILFYMAFDKAITLGISPEAALSNAQTMVVTFIIMFQIFYLLNCRSLRDSVMKIGFFSNSTIFVGVGIVLLLQLVFIYTPFMQNVFGTSTLSVMEMGIAIFAGFLIFPIISIEKWVRKKISVN
ncbi:MAG: HAD-IC family P-type ATPase [Paludibacter sp.]|nr:HAD-IC family P-type ATPase [Paludibacter sp.]